MKQHSFHHLWRWSFGLFISGLLVGCSDETQLFDVVSADDELRLELQASIDQINRSRADDSGFADGDRFGVFVVNYRDNQPGSLAISGNQVNNVAFSYFADVNKWQAATDIYWRDAETSADVYGYYPYNTGLDNVDSYQFEVQYDQSNISAGGEMSNYEASDFLWSKSAGAKPGQRVELTFRHIMAGVAVTLEKGSGFEDGAWEQLSKFVTVDNTIRTANIDLSTGVVSPSGTFDRHVEMCQEPGGTYRAVVVPQSVAAGKSIIGITIDGVAYNFIRDGGMTYTSGKLHNFTIKIDKKDSGDYEITLISQEITPWENDQLTHNFFEYEYTTASVKEPGTLKSAIVSMGKDFTKIKNLKIIGPINTDDFTFMRTEMSELAMLNMKETKCVEIHWERNEETSQNHWETVVYHMDNAIPMDAFYGKKSLRRIIFPDEIEYIGANAFREIGLDVNSSIVLPKNLKHIEDAAFAYIEEAGELIMNDKLEYIGDNVFTPHFHCDFNLPSTLKHIGSHAFGGNGGQLVTGNFRLPDNLEYIGESAFGGVEYDGVGELIVPDFMTELIPIYPAFKRGVTITFHDNINKIKHIALYNTRFINKVIIPSKVTHIEESAFAFCVFNAD